MICGRYQDVRCIDNYDNIRSAPTAKENEGDPGRGTSALYAELSLPAISEGFEENTFSTNWPSCIESSWRDGTDWLVLKHSVRFPSRQSIKSFMSLTMTMTIYKARLVRQIERHAFHDLRKEFVHL